MTNKPEIYKLIPKFIIIVNALFIIAMIFFHKGINRTIVKEEPCPNAKKINADALNSISIKLM